MLGTLTELLCHFYQFGHFHQLEAVARTILTSIPDDIVALHFLGLAYLRTGRTGEAMHLFRRIDRSKPSSDQVCDPAAGPTRRDAGAPTAAAAIYREATDLNPGFADTWYDIAMELDRLGHCRRALMALHNALVARPDFPEALLALGGLGLRLGDSAAARRGYDGLLRLDADSIEAKQGLARLANQLPLAEPGDSLFAALATER